MVKAYSGFFMVKVLLEFMGFHFSHQDTQTSKSRIFESELAATAAI